MGCGHDLLWTLFFDPARGASRRAGNAPGIEKCDRDRVPGSAPHVCGLLLPCPGQFLPGAGLGADLYSELGLVVTLQPEFSLFPDRQMQVKREWLIRTHSFQWTDVLLQPLMTSMAVFAAFHPLDQFLPGAGNVRARVLHF